MEEKIKKLIEYFSKQYKGLSRTQLMKLIYLFDRSYYMRTGKTYTGLKWILYYYGPFSPKIQEVYFEMKKEGKIKEMIGLIRYYISSPESTEDISWDDQIAEDVAKEIDEQIKKHDLLSSVDILKQYVYRLPEIEEAKFADEIKFSIIKS